MGSFPEGSHLHGSGSLNVNFWFIKLLDDITQDGDCLSNEILMITAPWWKVLQNHS